MSLIAIISFTLANIICFLLILRSAFDLATQILGKVHCNLNSKIMPWCTAYNCNTSSAKGKNPNRYSFHQYPLNDKDLLDDWLNNVKRKGFKPTVHSTLCSKHFEDACFEEDLYKKYVGRSPGKRKKRTLKKGSVPTIFFGSSVPKTRETSIKRQKKRIHDEVMSKLSFSILTCLMSGRNLSFPYPSFPVTAPVKLYLLYKTRIGKLSYPYIYRGWN